MKKILVLTAMAIVLASPGLAASNIKAIKSDGHQPIKAQVQNDDPANFTIDVGKMANINVNKNAPTYAMYTTPSLPSRCADFRNENIGYKKPDKFHRIFDLSRKPEVIQALKDYGCVVIPNKPKLPPAKS